jgi:hypothetical protein
MDAVSLPSNIRGPVAIFKGIFIYAFSVGYRKTEVSELNSFELIL